MTDLRLISETCVLQHMRTAARRVTLIYEKAFAPLDLTASQFSTLVAIGRDEGASISALAERIGMDRTTMTRVLAPLERRGLVEMGYAKGDARLRTVRLGKEGKRLLPQALRLWEEAQKVALSRIGADRWRDIRSRLAALDD